jgi:hypothetical protein
MVHFMVHFEAVQKAIPELKGDGHKVVVVGYPPGCPGTNAALAAINANGSWKGHSLMVEVPRHEVGALKDLLNYEGTWPIVFVRGDDGKMEHVGGGSDLLKLARAEPEPQYS